MLDTMTSRNHRDFNARYMDTFGFLTQGSPPTRKLVHIVDANEERVYFKQDDSEMKFHANCDAGVMFEFIPVDHGWYNVARGAPVLLERVPARQWKRGISRSNTCIYALQDTKENRYSSLNPIRPSFTVLNAVFTQPVPYAFDPERKTGVAFSKHFVLTPAKKVMFYRAEIGAFDGTRIVLDSSIVEQEVRDALRRCGATTEVIVNG